MNLMASVSMALLIGIGRNEIIHGRMKMATFMVFIIALFKLYDPVRKFAYFYNSFQQAMGASGSIFAFLDHTDDVKEKQQPVSLQRFKSSISFEDVGFSYSNKEGAHQLLHNAGIRPNASQA